jgi:hypothetical protein
MTYPPITRSHHPNWMCSHRTAGHLAVRLRAAVVRDAPGATGLLLEGEIELVCLRELGAHDRIAILLRAVLDLGVAILCILRDGAVACVELLTLLKKIASGRLLLQRWIKVAVGLGVVLVRNVLQEVVRLRYRTSSALARCWRERGADKVVRCVATAAEQDRPDENAE